ncbi:MAG TPA: hypothetical protein VNL17_03220 [Verrucomicrobiae bacterium]|nr:hypothetical protein [Verrucomicrobiae bacterium]
MKLRAQPVIWTHRAWPRADVLVDGRCEDREDTAAAKVERKAVTCRQTASDSLSVPLRIVGVLAFCQALVFIVLFLFICARAGAATVGKPTSDLALSLSAYTPQSERDPFGSEAPKLAGATQPVGPDLFKLHGILYSAANPSALVNDQLVELNKTAKVHTVQGDVEVKALKITRELVLLDVGGQQVELRLGGAEHNPPAK